MQGIQMPVCQNYLERFKLTVTIEGHIRVCVV